jgi:hypothetical protein
MEQKSSDEFLGWQDHGFLLVVTAIITPLEFDMSIVDIHEPMIGNGDTVGVTAHVVHDLLRTAEGRLGVKNPFRSPRLPEITSKGLRLSLNTSSEAKNCNWPASKASCKYFKNSLRNNRDNTRTGRKKPGRHEIHEYRPVRCRRPEQHSGDGDESVSRSFKRKKQE